MAIKILDSWALMAFLQEEPAAPHVEKLIVEASEGKHRLLLCVVNWGEIYYSFAHADGIAAAEEVVDRIATLEIELVLVSDDLELVREAAKLKASRKMSYTDCFAAALAKVRKGEVVTGDPEFKMVENEIKIMWLPRK